MSATNLVPGWVADRFNTLYRQPYDASSYRDVINAMLTSLFPTTKRFIVKTQPLRSISMGHSNADGNFDFVVCIRTPTLDADVPFLLYVVKRDDEDEASSQVYMERYVHWARRYQSRVSPWARIGVMAVLVMGARSQVYNLSPDADFVSPSHNVDTTSNYIFEILRSLYDAHASR